MISSLKRVIKFGWAGFKRQAGLSIATVFIMTLAIAMITGLVLFREVSQAVIDALQERVDISVYFNQVIPEAEILKIKEEIAKVPEVREVEYVSQEEAARRLIARRPELEESVRETQGFLNIASLNIKVFEAGQYAAVAAFLENSSMGEQISVDYYERKPVIEKIFNITLAIKRSGLVLSFILSLVAFSVAFNQIKLAILHSKEEIGIQRLVGASNWFIRGPFLVQGAIAGILATLACLVIFSAALAFLGPRMEFLFPDLNMFHYFVANFFLILLVQLLTGIGLGVVSSLIAIRKYLEV